MPKPRDYSKCDYTEDLSFGRIFLGMGPKTIRTLKPKAVVAAAKAAEVKRPAAVALPVHPSTAAILPNASVTTPASEPTAAVTWPAHPNTAATLPNAFVTTPAPEPTAVAPQAACALTTAEVDAWTDVQDALLLGLKALGKTWREIGLQVVEKATEDLRERYTVLTGVKDGVKKVEAVVKEVKKGEKKEKREKKKNKKNSGQGAASDPEVKGGELTKNKKDTQLRETLKPHQGPEQWADAALGQQDEDGQQKSIRGHPIIYVNLDDDLSAGDLRYLANIHEGLDHEKWFQLSCKLWNKTGKEVSADVLKKKLGNLFF